MDSKPISLVLLELDSTPVNQVSLLLVLYLLADWKIILQIGN